MTPRTRKTKTPPTPLEVLFEVKTARRARVPELSSSSNSNHDAAPWPEDVTGEAFARLVGLPDSRRVRELVEAGIITRRGKDTYPVAGIAAYCEHLRTSEKSEDQRRYEKSRADLYSERAAKARTERLLLEGSSFDSQAILHCVGGMIAATRAKLLSIPNATAAAVAESSDPSACQRILADAIREVLTELSETVPTDAIINRFRDQSGQLAAPSSSDSES